MADLIFQQGIGTIFSNVSLNLIAPNTLREATSSGNFNLKEVVRIVYTDGYEKSVYAICTDNVGGATFEFDEKIYPVSLSTFNSEIRVYNTNTVHTADVYRIAVDVQNGMYSKAYTQYNSNISYSLIIPEKRIGYFGASDVIITSKDVVFVDFCDTLAYGVGLSEKSLDTLNNKFRSSLEFNIATR
jgi:hypothetical protein